MTTAEAVAVAFIRDFNSERPVWPDRPGYVYTAQWMTYSRPSMATAFAAAFIRS